MLSVNCVLVLMYEVVYWCVLVCPRDPGCLIIMLINNK